MAAKKKVARKTRRKIRKKIQAYVFIDTNIFLDFYRASNEASLSMLEKLERVRDRVICTYQVEMEFLKHRQREICGISKQSNLEQISGLPAVLSDTQLSESVTRARKDLTSKKAKLNKNLLKLLKNPSNDRVYNVLEKVFRSESDHVLTRDMDVKNKIKRLARRRFQLGYPPRKHDDTSMGDSINWEWIIHCAARLSGRFVIVSRDSDFGCQYDKKYFLNDQLRHEFRERVGQKSLVYTQKLSEALGYLDVAVTEKERKSEAEEIVRLSPLELAHQYQQRIAQINAIAAASSFTHPGSGFVNLNERIRENQDRMRLLADIGKPRKLLDD